MEQLLDDRTRLFRYWRKWVIGVSPARFDDDNRVSGIGVGKNLSKHELLTDEVQRLQFSELYRDMYTEVRTYTIRRLDLDLVEDVLAETFLVVWRRWADLPEDSSGRRAWIYGILRNKMMQATDTLNRQLRLMWRAGSLLESEAAPDTLDIGALREARRLLDLLPPGERDALSLMVLAGLTSAETAATLGCSVSSVTTRVARARKRLLRILTEQAPGRDKS